MVHAIRHTLVTILVGLLLAGPSAAAVLALLPAEWRVPAVPLLAAAGTILLVGAVRGLRPPQE
ncbi:MAG: hypothetical protein NTY02_10090 [Acidobacteria bacterium]|nr:hypothetical protein [Acidobacteriota bacterium]